MLAIFFTVSALLISFTARATEVPCLKNFDDDRKLVEGPLTPSKWFLEGDDLARRVIAELPRHGDTANPGVWLAFQHDLRWQKRSVGRPSEALGAAMDFGPWYDQWTDLLRKILRGSRVRKPKFFVTWELTGIRAINRLAARRIYVAGLTVDPMHVDDEELDNIEYTNHDVGHAYAAETLRYPCEVVREGVCKASPERLFYRTFDYERITRPMDARRHLLFDVGYFLYFHERIGENLWTGRYRADPERVTRAEVAQMYRNFDGVHVEVSDDDVRVIVPKLDVTVRRFENRHDLYVNLPLEVKSAMAEHPKPHRLVREFVNEAQSVFFTEHYRHSLRLFGPRENVRVR